jgi:hypothetical protein
VIILGGGALLGWIALSMAITDPVVKPVVAPYGDWLNWIAPLLGAMIVILAGKIASVRQAGRVRKIVDLAAGDHSPARGDEHD